MVERIGCSGQKGPMLTIASELFTGQTEIGSRMRPDKRWSRDLCKSASVVWRDAKEVDGLMYWVKGSGKNSVKQEIVS